MAPSREALARQIANIRYAYSPARGFRSQGSLSSLIDPDAVREQERSAGDDYKKTDNVCYKAAYNNVQP